MFTSHQHVAQPSRAGTTDRTQVGVRAGEGGPRGSIACRLLLVLGWVTGAAITLYAVANFVQHALMDTGAINTPEALGTNAVPWHIALWDPFWLIGGLLFLVATRVFQKSP